MTDETIVEFVVVEVPGGFCVAWRLAGGPIMGQSASFSDRDFANLMCREMEKVARQLGRRDPDIADIVPGLFGLNAPKHHA